MGNLDAQHLTFLILSDGLNHVTPGLGNKPGCQQAHQMERTSVSSTNSRNSCADLIQKEVWGQQLMTSRTASQPGALSGLLLLESWCLHIQGTGPKQEESSINKDCCSESSHPLPSLLLPLQLLQVPWMLSGSVITLPDCPYSISPSWPLSTFLVPAP